MEAEQLGIRGGYGEERLADVGTASRPHVGSIPQRGGASNVNARQASASGANVHCSIDSPCLAPMARSKRSVVARSAAIPFSSCPIDLHPFADRLDELRWQLKEFLAQFAHGSQALLRYVGLPVLD